MIIQNINIKISEPDKIGIQIGESDILRINLDSGLGHGTEASIRDHRDVSNIEPLSGQILKYNSVSGKYEPSDDIAGMFSWDPDYECYI